MKPPDSPVGSPNNLFMRETIIFTAESNFSRHFRGEKLASPDPETHCLLFFHASKEVHRFCPFHQSEYNRKTGLYKRREQDRLSDGSRWFFHSPKGRSAPRTHLSNMQTNIRDARIGISILKIHMVKPDHFIPPIMKNRMVPVVHIPSQRKSAGCIFLA